MVIAIIGILAALLLPALKKARDQVKTTVCISMLRHGGLAFSNYAGDYNGLLPRTATPDPNADIYQKGWDFVLADYMQGATFSSGGNSTPSFKPAPSWMDSSGRVAYKNLDRLTFYCPGYNRTMDILGHTPAYANNAPDVATWTGLNAIGSYQMNPWLGFYGDTRTDR